MKHSIRNIAKEVKALPIFRQTIAAATK